MANASKGTQQAAISQHAEAGTDVASTRQGLAVFDGLCDRMLSTEGREVVATGDPLEAELWASRLLGMFSGLLLIDQPDPATAIGGRLVAVASSARPRTPRCACVRLLQSRAAALPGGRNGRLPTWRPAEVRHGRG